MLLNPMKPIDFQPRRFLTYRSTVLYIASLAIAVASICRAEDIGIPTIDLDQRSDLQVIVDRQPKVYLGHPTTLLLEDGKTRLLNTSEAPDDKTRVDIGSLLYNTQKKTKKY